MFEWRKGVCYKASAMFYEFYGLLCKFYEVSCSLWGNPTTQGLNWVPSLVAVRVPLREETRLWDAGVP